MFYTFVVVVVCLFFVSLLFVVVVVVLFWPFDVCTPYKVQQIYSRCVSHF